MATTTSRGLPLAALALVLAGCANDREVVVRLPISRLELPEPGPRMFDFAIAQTGEIKAVLTPDQVNVAPDPSAPELRVENDAMARFAFTPRPYVTVSLKGQSSLGGVQAKVMPFAGAGAVSFAGTAFYATGEDQYEVSGSAFTDAESELLDFALIAGIRLSPTTMAYGGVYHSNLSYDGHHRSTRGGDPDVAMEYAGELESLGGNVGLGWSFGRWGRLLAEYSHASVEGGASRRTEGHAAIAFEVFFGALATAVKVPQRKEPIEVVPPVDD